MRQPPFEDTLEACLEALFERGESLEAVLSRYPQEAPRLRPLLEAALAVKEAVALEPSPQARSLLRQRLALARPRPRPVRVWRWVAVPLAAALALLIAGGGTVLAAADSTPGAVLYPVKVATERVRLAFTRGEAPRARLELKLAQERGEEMMALARQGQPQEVADLAQRLEGHLDRFRTLLPPDDEAALAELAGLLADSEARQQARFEALLAQAPPEARPALAQALRQARFRYEQGWQALEGFLPPPASPGGPPPGSGYGTPFWVGVVERTGEGQIEVRGRVIHLTPGAGDFRPGQRVLLRVQPQPDGSFVVLEARRLGFPGGRR